MSIQYVTKETLDKLQAELQKMKAVDRPAAAKAIAEAREKGDLKENAEYDAAKEKQAFIEGRIKEIEDKLARAQIVDPKEIRTDKNFFRSSICQMTLTIAYWLRFSMVQVLQVIEH